MFPFRDVTECLGTRSSEKRSYGLTIRNYQRGEGLKNFGAGIFLSRDIFFSVARIFFKAQLLAGIFVSQVSLAGIFLGKVTPSGYF